MATSLQQLFHQIAARTGENAPGGPPSMIDAAGALDHASRALQRLADGGLGAELGGPHEMLAKELSAACRAAGTLTWRHTGGELTDLMGAAADLAVTDALELGRGQRWAITVEFAAAADHCAALAQRGLRYKAFDFGEVRRLAKSIERAAQLDPPTPLARAALDRLVPQSELAPAWTGTHVAAEASASLLSSIEHAEPRGGLTLREMKAVTMAAETISGYAAAAVTGLTDDGHGQPWRAAPVAWQVVRNTTGIFDDGRWSSPTDPKDIIAAADLIQAALRYDLGPASTMGRESLAARVDLPLLVTELQQTANQTPLIAAQLHSVARRWAGDGSLHAPAADLPPMDKMPVARIQKVLTQQRIRATGKDLEPMVRAIARAGALSNGLAAALNEIPASRPVTQPNLAAIYARRASGPAAVEGLARAAHEVEHALAAVRAPFVASPSRDGPAR